MSQKGVLPLIISIVMLVIDIILLFEIMSHKKRNYIYMESSKLIFLGALIALSIFVYKAITEVKFGVTIDTFKFIVNAIFLIELIIMTSFSLKKK